MELFFQEMSSKQSLTSQIKPVTFSINEQTYTGEQEVLKRYLEASKFKIQDHF